MLLAANCGGGDDQDNPPPPRIVIDAQPQILDVGETFTLDASATTDPNGQEENLEFQWNIVGGGVDDTDFQDHCREDFSQICDENDDDHCSNDSSRLCNSDDDCLNVGICELNSGTTSPDCTIGICELGEGDEGPVATFVANVAGPFSVRLTAIGDESNATKTIVVNTFPSLYVAGAGDDGSLVEFGGTEGKLLGRVEDADEFATTPLHGAADPANGNLVVIDQTLDIVRVFELRTGAVLGPFGESDRFVENPVALAFNPEDNNRLYIAEAGGRVLMFDDTTQLLISKFTDIDEVAKAIAFVPGTGDMLVVDGTPGVKVYSDTGVSQGVLGETGTATTEPVDLDFLDDDTLLIADASGKVVRCNEDGNNCQSFSTQLDGLLAAGSPSAIAVNPSAEATNNDVLVADPVGGRVIACNSNGSGCGTFGDTDEIDSEFRDIFFAPQQTPTTTTSSTTSTTLE